MQRKTANNNERDRMKQTKSNIYGMVFQEYCQIMTIQTGEEFK